MSLSTAGRQHEAGAGGDHRLVPAVDSVDDFVGVDALQVDAVRRPASGVDPTNPNGGDADTASSSTLDTDETSGSITSRTSLSRLTHGGRPVAVLENTSKFREAKFERVGGRDRWARWPAIEDSAGQQVTDEIAASAGLLMW
jgi:hypothetical protein